MKKFVNDVAHVVEEELQGMVLLYPNVLRRLVGTNVIVRRDSPIIGKVALVSGGGSGHEPLHCGYVGRGMLDGAIAGEIFTSPPPNQIYDAIREVHGGKGVLLIVKNYAGDIMNFKLAEELATDNSIEIKHVIIHDDIALTPVERRRGVAGTILCHKIAGAKAEEGADLVDVERLAQRVVSNVRSMGVALTSCTLLHVGKPMFALQDDEMELGIGIHGERGVQRTKMVTADQIAEVLVSSVSDDLDLKKGDEVVTMINGMGGTSLMELLIISRKALQLLGAREIKNFKSLIGNFVTSLDMAGASLTLLRVDDEMKAMLLAPQFTPNFPMLI